MRVPANRRQKSLMKSLIPSNYELISFWMAVLIVSLQSCLIISAAVCLLGKVQKRSSNVCRAAVNDKSSQESLTWLKIVHIVAGTAVFFIHSIAMNLIMLKELKIMVVSK